MGFGILLIGYALAFAFALSPYYFFADIFGGLVMAYAFFKLSAFQRKFRYAGITSIIYAVFSCINMLERLSIVDFPPIIGKLTEALVAGCVITVHIFMFISISALAEEVGLPKLNMKARRNLIVLILYYLFYSLALYRLTDCMIFIRTLLYIPLSSFHSFRSSGSFSILSSSGRAVNGSVLKAKNFPNPIRASMIESKRNGQRLRTGYLRLRKREIPNLNRTR